MIPVNDIGYIYDGLSECNRIDQSLAYSTRRMSCDANKFTELPWPQQIFHGSFFALGAKARNSQQQDSCVAMIQNKSSSSVMLSPSGKTIQKRPLSVRFHPTVRVFYFSLDISDNPGSTSGPPIQLSWEVVETQDVDIVAWESRERHGSRVLKIHSAMRMELLKEHGVSRRDIQFYQKCANIIRARRRISVERAQWDRIDEVIEKAYRMLLCRFSEVEIFYPKGCKQSSSTEVERANETTKQRDKDIVQNSCKRHSCPHFGVLALEMDEPNCENALMYNAEFTQIFRRVSMSRRKSSDQPSLEDSFHAGVRRANLFRASFQEYCSNRSLDATATADEMKLQEPWKRSPEESGYTFLADSSYNTEKEFISSEIKV